MLADTVVHACQFGDELGIGAKAYVPRIHGVLEGKGTFELSEAYIEEFILLPFCPGIYDAHAFFVAVVSRFAVQL